jgi:hypothetical protein
VAVKEGQKVGVEVKGFPSKRYADPTRAHEVKPTQPSTQARTWYANGLLAALQMTSREPMLIPVLALPEFLTYHNLYADTRRALDLIGVQVWWVSEDGTVTTED